MLHFIPLAFFWVLLLTETYGYTLYRQCWIVQLDENCTRIQMGYVEVLVLWYIPVLAHIFLLCLAFVIVTVTLAIRWCKEKLSCSSDEMESLVSSHSSHHTVLKDTFILFGCPCIDDNNCGCCSCSSGCIFYATSS